MRSPAARGRSILASAALVFAAVTTGALSVPALAATDAFVRVNQVGYPSDAAKRAYLMSGVAETGGSFEVRNAGGTAVYTAPIGQNLGSWSSAYPFVYALDFGAVTAPGTYTVVVSGPAPASSPGFVIGGGQQVYQQALENALFFFQTERDGPDFVPNALRTAPAHLNDQSAMTYLRPHVSPSGRFSGDLTPLGVRIDASGGWWDAGDYIKGVQTLSYTTDMLLVGVRDFPGQMGAGSATSNFTAEAKFGADWLLRMWDDATRTFYFQVGIGTGNARIVGDHDLWRLPQADDTFGGSDPAYRYIRERPVFRSGPPGSLISPNLAGRSAAALALCFQIYRSSDPAFANDCLLAAQHIFALADTNPKGNLLTYLPFSFYPETEWRSDLELAAVELSLAMSSGGLPAPDLPHANAGFYLQQAAHWAHEYIVGPDDAADTLNLYDVSGLAHYELHRAIERYPSPLPALEVTKADLVADIKKALDNAIAQASTDPFQFGFPWSTWDTATHGTGLAVMAAEYAQLTGSSVHAEWGGRWLGNVLGANAWGSSFIVGDGSTFPRCLHHQVANLVGHLDGTPPILKGAVVEGPNGTLYTGLQAGMNNCPPDDTDRFAPFNSQRARFKDDIESFSTVEPAVDLSATSPLAFAWQSVPVPPPPPGGGSETVVSIQFDDGVADQIGTLPLLQAHGMQATFYVNSAVIGDAAHLSWEQLTDLGAAGNEIAGHTLHHVNLKPLKEADARLEVCGDRVALFDHGFQPTSFAYPFGGFDAGAQAVVAACGYNSGRGVAGVNGTSVFAETIPPADAYATRTPPNPKQGTTLATIEGYVQDAAANGGGWVQLVFHHLCDGCDAYAITAADFGALLEWLEGQESNGVVVRTTDEVIGGPVQPPVAP